MTNLSQKDTGADEHYEVCLHSPTHTELVQAIQTLLYKAGSADAAATGIKFSVHGRVDISLCMSDGKAKVIVYVKGGEPNVE